MKTGEFLGGFLNRLILHTIVPDNSLGREKLWLVTKMFNYFFLLITESRP